MRKERLDDLCAPVAEAPTGESPTGEAPTGEAPEESVVAIGNFDGVHRGHRETLALARREAARLDAAFAAVTFDPHPARVLRPARAPKAITTLEARARRLADAGVERLLVVRFHRGLAALPAEDFVELLLVRRLGVRAVVQGRNFRFGRGRAGDLDTLRAVGARRGFRVIESPAVDFEGAPISSSRIRDALAEGLPEQAAAMLGRPYAISGAVVPGAGRGRVLGFPTANLVPDPDLLLREGVYAAEALPGAAPDGGTEPPAAPTDAPSPERWRPALVHFGPRPTFAAGVSLEAHLPGFSGEISSLRLRFRRYLRPVRTFPGAEALRRQLQRDAAAAGEIARPGRSASASAAVPFREPALAGA